MQFLEFANLCDRLKATKSRLTKTELLASFLKKVSDGEVETTCLFLLGKVFPDYDSRSLNVSWHTLKKVSGQIKGLAQNLAPLQIMDVSFSLSAIAELSGKGSRTQVQTELVALFSRAAGGERDCLMRIIFGEMRIGVAEGLLLDGIARAADVPLAKARRANMYIGNPGEIAGIALRSGATGLDQISLQLFRPVQPMLAQLASDFAGVFAGHGGRTALEYKLDGARVQIHKDGKQIRIFSRNLSDVTGSLPDVVELVMRQIRADSLIVEGEVIAVDGEGRPLPFQELMRRFRRVHNIAEAQQEVPVRLCLFDLLYLDGKPLVEAPYNERTATLISLVGQQVLVPRLITDDEGTAERFLEKAQKEGHEGLMAKRLDSGYQPGARGKKWFKIKPAETLDLVVIAAEWGSGRRVGWLSNYHLAARDESTGEFLMLGKTFKGLTDQQFKWMTEKLLSLKVDESEYVVHVKPELVVEVAYNEIQRSPHYNSKFALRFARIKHIRENKKPVQADTMARLRRLYEKQFERKGRTRS